MNDHDSQRSRYYVTIETSSLRIPISVPNVEDAVSVIVHQLQLYGRPLALYRIPAITSALIAWSDSTAKTWTTTHQDAVITVRRI
jgi:hypothetical protein